MKKNGTGLTGKGGVGGEKGKNTKVFDHEFFFSPFLPPPRFP
jgi:hypothetical protein